MKQKNSLRTLNHFLWGMLTLTASFSSISNEVYEANESDSVNYKELNHWLCHPEVDSANNICELDQTTITVFDGGEYQITEHDEIKQGTPLFNDIDCFYVYPTASADLTANSDLNVDAQEELTTLAQFTPYSRLCRTFAPIYRQRTLTYLGLDAVGLSDDETIDAADQQAYRDVQDAFHHYMNEENDGRGYILVGHSQGARLLNQLIQDEIAHNSDWRSRFIAAHIPGANITETSVTPEATVTQKNTHLQTASSNYSPIPICQQKDDVQCIVTYSAYYRDDQALASPRFGITSNQDETVACVNPAQLLQDNINFPVFSQPIMPLSLPPITFLGMKWDGDFGPFDNAFANQVTRWNNQFFAVPEQINTECVFTEGGAHILAVSVEVNPLDRRADNYPGELYIVSGWGLHLNDISLVLGDLLELGNIQINNWKNLQSH